MWKLSDGIVISGKKFDIFPFLDGTTVLAGESNAHKQTIHYKSDQGKEVLKDTMLHETIHVIDYDCQLEMSERQVHALASNLLSTLRHNKEFAKWLIS